ncbi:DUF1080 domain-containing protein [Maribellus luteus]|uniref:DUF1080 domain-containing protein n=1 Tax=Maribellus luteus TaxID=2305463 RepID=A0A399SRY6_9BACT|nr:DUF1080 domain-containing protein [Maribellus luteus]RIJ45694.1 DUF1080 domain-containing protein [Maribellus luteus]
MNSIKKCGVLSMVVLSIALTACTSKPKAQKAEETKSAENWIQLFNGKDLNDWDIKFKGEELGVNYKNTFRVEDGLLRVSYDNWDGWDGTFGHIFYKGEFSHYKLRVEYRFVGDQVKGGPGWAYRNNGLMLHGQSAESMELDQDFPTSIEVQLLGGNGTDDRPTLNVCTPGTNIVMDGLLTEQHCMSSDSKTFHGDQWVTVEVEVHGGDVIRHLIDGKEVLSYEKPQYDPKDKYAQTLIPENGDLIITKGTISLQAESGPTDFRKVELLILE